MIVARAPLPFAITEPSQVGEARRQILGLAGLVGLDAGQQGKLALVVNELGSNLVKHAGGGELLVRALEDARGDRDARPGSRRRHGQRRRVLPRWVLDRGQPGHRTGRGGAPRAFVDVYSTRPGGTAIVARVDADGRREARVPPVQVGAVSVPKAGEDVCGDGFAVAADLACPDRDGRRWPRPRARRRGRGPPGRGRLRARAGPAARRAGRRRSTTRSGAAAARRWRWRASTPAQGIDRLLRDRQRRGSDRRRAAATRHLVSGNGTAGHTAGRINEFTYPWSDDALLVMHSDGLGSRWQIERYPGLPSHHPALVAGVLYRDWSRGRDDVTVVAVRRRLREPAMSLPLVSLFVRHEQDVVAVRQRAREIAARLGFDGQDQTRIATAVSEIARNAFMYAGGGKVEIVVEGRHAPQLLVVRVSDRGPGHPGSRRDPRGPVPLLDRHGHRHARGPPPRGSLRRVEPARRGRHRHPRQAVPAPSARDHRRRARGPRRRPRAARRPRARWRRSGSRTRSCSARSTSCASARRISPGSTPSCRIPTGASLALYAELDEKADTLRRADEMKSRFLSNMSHEFRTPLNSMMALSRLLLEDPRAPADRRAAAPGRLHPPGRRGSHRAGERPARPRQGRGGQDR